ncbi:MFS transporter [Streptomyces fuscichromogenes]|uniref:Cyanate transporter n=1 Tax=Streptomyces fuscichromogenes TaxID=1324013 RepID=A0A917XFG2_9ACTN|nr:MFS transporter [Streptomyces fuscichromogenes]GGN20290.1 cyanate transporter [Streptomyces fuscichromogenes]
MRAAQNDHQAVTPTRGRPRTGLALAGIILIAFNLRSSTAGIGTVLPNVVADLHWSATLASGLVVLPLLCYAVLSPLAPALADAVGPDRAVLLGLAVLTAGIGLRSLPGGVWIWAGTALLGAGIAVLNVITPALVKRDFPTRTGGVTAAYSAIQGGAAAMASIAVALIIGSGDGLWRQALASSCVFAVTALAFWAFRTTGTPQVPAAPRHPTGAGRPKPSPWHRGLAWHIALFMSMQATVFYVLITWLPSIEQQHGVTAVQAGLHQSYLQAASLVATGLSIPLLRRGSDLRMMVAVSTTIMAAGIAGILAAPALTTLWAILVGTGGGLTLVTALSLFGLRTREASETGALSAMGQTVGYAFAAAGPVLLGALHDATGGWDAILIVLLGLLAAQTFFGLRAAKPGFVWPDPAQPTPGTVRKSCFSTD